MTPKKVKRASRKSDKPKEKLPALADPSKPREPLETGRFNIWELPLSMYLDSIVAGDPLEDGNNLFRDALLTPVRSIQRKWNQCFPDAPISETKLLAFLHEATGNAAPFARKFPIGRVLELLDAKLARNESANAAGEWSEPLSPGDWAKRFKWTAKTFMRHVRAGKIRVQKLSSKSYRVHVRDLL